MNYLFQWWISSFSDEFRLLVSAWRRHKWLPGQPCGWFLHKGKIGWSMNLTWGHNKWLWFWIEKQRKTREKKDKRTTKAYNLVSVTWFGTKIWFSFAGVQHCDGHRWCSDEDLQWPKLPGYEWRAKVRICSNMYIIIGSQREPERARKNQREP